MSALLIRKKTVNTDVYTYEINSNDIKECGIVNITFVNQKFSEAIYPLKDKYSRKGWEILAAINEEIKLIESTYYSSDSPDGQ